MSEYHLKKVQLNEKWDNFVEYSENGTLFSSSKYLLGLSINTAQYFCYRNNELRAALLVVEDQQRENLVLNDFVIYSGIMMGRPTNNQNRSQMNSEKYRIAEFIANKLPDLYKSIELALHPSWIDIRPFLWVNYHNEGPKFDVNLRYTSYLDISCIYQESKLENNDVFLNTSKSRRQEIRYAAKDGLVTEVFKEEKKFVALYQETFKRQGLSVENEKVLNMEKLLGSLQSNKVLKMYAAKTRAGEIASLACFANDSKRAYYLFGANNPEYRDAHAGTAVLWDAFINLNKDGVNEVDLEGVNSPNRGWFKMSFGGDLIPYYELVMK
jgi:hypothetical protein